MKYVFFYLLHAGPRGVRMEIHIKKAPGTLDLHRLAHMSYHYLIAFGHRSTRGVHEHMLERFLNRRCTLCFGFADEAGDGRVLQSGLL